MIPVSHMHGVVSAPLRVQQNVIDAWVPYFKQQPWRQLIYGVVPIVNANGRIYELSNGLDRDNESIAIADMRDIVISEPHYHSAGAYEVYYMLEGEATVVVANTLHTMCVGDVLEIPPLQAHYVVARRSCVLAIIDIPAFNLDAYHVVTASQPDVGYDAALFERLGNV